MVYPSDTLHLSHKLHARRVRARCSFQVFGGAKFCKHLAFDAPLFAAGCYPARLVAGSVGVALQADVVLLISTQLLRQFTHHVLTRSRLQIRQQRCQPLIHFMQIFHVSPSTFLLARRVLAPPQPLRYRRQC